jgi:uncharacterized protein (UPF0276 family)
VTLNHQLLKHVDETIFGADGIEVILENFIANPEPFCRARGDRPMSFHSVALFPSYECVANSAQLGEAKRAIDEYRPDLVSFHLGKGTLGGVYTDRLIPIAYSHPQLNEVVYAIKKIQDYLGRNVLLENISQYFIQPGSEMSAIEFLIETTQRANCGAILDITNILVNRSNFHQSERGFDKLLEMGVVVELHIAGYSTNGEILVDSHDSNFSLDCEVLLRNVLRRCGPVIVTLERDDNINDGEAVCEELRRLRCILNESDGISSRIADL